MSRFKFVFVKSMLVNKLNLDVDQLEQSNYFFSTVAFSGKHDSSVIGVTMGDYDAAAVAGATIKKME
ncbi:MAG: PhnD/SsuA/transferrin family substrate-binding protein, partial [Clostridia bacterium]